jgi:hypothetical protein
MNLRADSVDISTAGPSAPLSHPARAGETPSSALQFWVSSKSVSAFLAKHHYLGPVARGFAWSDEWGVVVLAKPTARRLPQDGTWLELVRWCLVGARNGGSRQWARIAKTLRRENPNITTVVSYSDPYQGHSGALYKASGWMWAPTWHRLRPPPSGNGSWKNGETQAVKDRWIYKLRPDARRFEILRVKDDAIVKRYFRDKPSGDGGKS